MFKDLNLKLFLICCSIGIHSSSFSPNLLLKEEVAQGGGRGDASGRLSRNVIKRDCMGEYGMGTKVERGSVVSREKGMPKGFWGVAKGLTKFTSPLGEKRSLFTAKELTVCFSKARGGRWVMSDGEMELLVEGFS
jgi:hypothetical protein